MKSKYFVPFETAQRLKEKGYPQDKSDYGYFDNGDSHPIIMFPADNFDCAATTYHEVVDWLEGKGIYVTTCIDMLEVCGSGKIKWACFIFPFGGKETSRGGKHTREEALNAGILAALKML